jgi:hypothetical protein
MFEKTKTELKSIYKTTKEDIKRKYDSENIHVIYSVARELLDEKIKKDIRGRLEDLRPCDLLDIVRMSEKDESSCYAMEPKVMVTDPIEEKKAKIQKKVTRGRKTKRVKKQK